MKDFCILTDTYVGMNDEEIKNFDLYVVPMPVIIDEVEYFENVNITREEFFEKIKTCKKLSTSQPSPETVKKMWDDILVEYEKILYIPLSSGMSGTYNTVNSMSLLDEYKDRVLVVDAKRVSAPMRQSVEAAVRLHKRGDSAMEIKEKLEVNAPLQRVYLMIQTFEYLKRGGRIMGLVSLASSILNIKPIVVFDVGVTKLYKMTRGVKAATKEIIEALKKEMNTAFKIYEDSKKIVISTATAFRDEATKIFEREIEEAFPDITVEHYLLPLVLCTHSGPGALGACISIKAD